MAFPAGLPDTTITTPIEGRGREQQAVHDHRSARVATGSVGRVQVQIQDRDTGQYLHHRHHLGNTGNSLNATLDAGTTTRTWSIPATHHDQPQPAGVRPAFTAATGGTGDSTRASKLFESFSTEDQTPTTSITGPSGIQTSTTFTMTGTANDDHGVNSLELLVPRRAAALPQADGTVSEIFNTFRGTPDVVGATSATWSYEVTLPHEGVWRGAPRRPTPSARPT